MNFIYQCGTFSQGNGKSTSKWAVGSYVTVAGVRGSGLGPKDSGDPRFRGQGCFHGPPLLAAVRQRARRWGDDHRTGEVGRQGQDLRHRIELDAHRHLAGQAGRSGETSLRPGGGREPGGAQ